MMHSIFLEASLPNITGTEGFERFFSGLFGGSR